MQRFSLAIPPILLRPLAKSRKVLPLIKFSRFFLAAIISAIVCLAPAVELSDEVTTYGKTLFSKEINHGAQVAVTSLFSGAITTDTEGRQIVLNSLMGSPGKFVINDLTTGKKLKQFSLNTNSAGSYATLVHSSGDIYLSSHPHGRLYRYSPGKDKLDDLGQCNPNVKNIWELEEITGGKIILACYPHARLVEFDPATSKFRDMGPAKDGEDYARAIAWHRPTNRLFIGVGSRPALICWDLTSGDKKDILPTVNPEESTVYNVDVINDKIVTRLSPSVKGLIFDANTLELYDRVDRMEGNQISGVAPDGESYYFTVNTRLMRHNLRTKHKEQIATVMGNTRAIGFPTVDGNKIVASVSYNGTINLVDPQKGNTIEIKQDLPSEPIDIHSLYGGPDNRIYTSGYVAGALGIFDPATQQSAQIDNVAQTEGASAIGNTMYFGTYPKARIVRYETNIKKHTNFIKNENPNEIFSLHSEGQDRPYAMLGIPETNECAVGTIPGYGKLGGTICIYNDDSKTTRTYSNILGNRSAVALAHKDGILYIGTTISGGLGIDPIEKEAVLIAIELATGKKLFETVPVPDTRIIGDLQLMPDGKIWGWAEATLFVFNPVSNKVEKTREVKKLSRHSGHMWRGSQFTSPDSSGKIFGLAGSEIYEINIPQFKLKKIANARGFSLIVHHAPSGSLFFARKHELFEWKVR